MQSDRQRWNLKYRERPMSHARAAHIVAKYHRLAAPGRALDIAAGTGANARYLAKKGFTVTAVDISDVGLAPLSGAHPRLQPVCLDLDLWDPPEHHYQLVTNLRYLNRRLFDPIIQSLVTGGILIFESFIHPPPVRDGDGPRCPDYLLRENELLHAFLSMEIVYYAEAVRRSVKGNAKLASLVAIRR